MAARTALTPIVVAGPFSQVGTVITFAAGDVANGNSCPISRREILLVQNADGAATHTVTVRSVADALGRTGDAVKLVGISGYHAFNLREMVGLQQADGNIYIDVDSAQLKLAVLQLPS